MVDVVDGGRSAAVGPPESPVAGDGSVRLAPAHRAVVGAAGEEQVVRVCPAAVCPLVSMVNLAVIAGLEAIGVGTSPVPGLADEALIRGGDALLAP